VTDSQKIVAQITSHIKKAGSKALQAWTSKRAIAVIVLSPIWIGTLTGLVIGANASITSSHTLQRVVDLLLSIPTNVYSDVLASGGPVAGQILGGVAASGTGILVAGSVLGAVVGYQFPNAVIIIAKPAAVVILIAIGWSTYGFTHRIAADLEEGGESQ